MKEHKEDALIENREKTKQMKEQGRTTVDEECTQRQNDPLGQVCKSRARREA